MFFWRSSIAAISGGQTNFAVNQMKIAKTSACANSVVEIHARLRITKRSA